MIEDKGQKTEDNGFENDRKDGGLTAMKKTLIIGCAMILAGIVLLIYIFKDSYLDS